LAGVRRIILLSLSLLALILVSTSSAYATVYVFDYSGLTSTIQSPSVSLQAGTSGSSTIDSVAADAATASATAGITFYESANLATTCTSPSADSSVTAPGTTGSFTLSGQTACLWTPQYTVSNSIYAGTSKLNLYAQTNVPAVDASVLTTTKYGLDAAVQGSGRAVGSIATSTSLTTAYTNELLIAYVAWTDTNSYTVSMSGGSLTWTARGSEQSNGNHHLEEFYAVASSTISAALTATFTGTISGGVVLTVFSIAGANTASPFDTHSGLPAPATGTSTAPTVSISTTNLYDLLIGGLSAASGTTAPTCTVGSGFTKAYGTGTACTRAGNSAATYAVGDSEYEYVTAAQNTKAVPETLSASEAWVIEADAIQMSAGVTLTTTHSPDVVIVSISSTTTFTPTVTDSSSLSWTNRKTITNTAQVTEWYAISSGTLSSDRIGTTFSALGGLYTIVAFAVDGANTASPFDGSTVTGTGSSTGPTVSLTTTVANDLVIGMVATGVTDTFTAGSGFAAIQSGSYGSAEDKAAATTGSNTVSYTLGTTTTWAIIADAIEAATAILTVSAYTTNSAGTSQNTLISSSTTGTITSSETEVSTSFSSSAGTIPASGYLEVTLTASASASVTIYWGTGQLTDFLTPSTYNYVLAISNPTTTAWSINLGVASSSTLTRLTNVTVWFVSPFSDQIVVSSGSLTQSSGSTVTLAASSTVDIAVAAYSNAIPTSSTSPSSLVLSLKIQPSTAPVYTQYTINLSIT
jgi:hypothetical protein